MKKTFSGIMVTLLLLATLALSFDVQPVEASGTIYIRADGSIDPPTADITTVDNITYTFDDNIYDEIVVERSNIIVDGNGCTLSGSGSGYGFNLASINNVTIQNTNIKNFYRGIYVYQSSFNSVSGNNITNNVNIGVWLYQSSSNTFSGNTITNNTYRGVVLTSSSNNTLTGNTITNNIYDGVVLSSSSFNTVSGNNITNNASPVYFESSSFNSVSGNNITNNDSRVVLGSSSNNNSVSGNTITNNGGGIWLWGRSSYNTFSGNAITNNTYDGVGLSASSFNSFSGNTITNNTYQGVQLSRSSNNVLWNNTMAGNRYSFQVEGSTLSHFLQDVDDSNTVDGKPVYYLVTRRDMEVPSDAGYVALVNSINITVEGLELKSNGQGILLANTTKSQITNNTITNNWRGLYLYESTNNSVSGNNMTNNDRGVSLSKSSYNTFSGNNMTNNGDGVDGGWSSYNTFSGNIIANNDVGVNFVKCSYNTFSGNTITNNDPGIWLYYGSDNKFYHNNFIDNTPQVGLAMRANLWDDGYPSGGNYWSDHSGADDYSGPDQDEPGSDGIIDSPYIIDADNQDNYPFKNKDGWGPITQIPVIRGGLRYDVTIESNATLTHVVATKTTLHFKATGPPGQTAYIKVTMPVGLNTTEIKVFIDGEWLQPPPWPEITTNSTHYFIYFEFTLSTKTITIQYSTLINSTPHIKPDTLNLKSEGEWITCYIELPEDHDVNDINIATVMLNGTVPAESDPIEVGDYDSDGVPDLMVKFDRESVIEYIEGNLGGLNPERTEPLTYEVTLTVTGLLCDGTPFEGSDTIRVLKFLKGQPEPT